MRGEEQHTLQKVQSLNSLPWRKSNQERQKRNRRRVQRNGETPPKPDPKQERGENFPRAKDQKMSLSRKGDISQERQEGKGSAAASRKGSVKLLRDQTKR